MSRSASTRRRLAPFKLWYFEQTFYLIAHCSLRDKVRIFVLDRISLLRVSDETFKIPQTFDAGAFMQNSFGIYQGPAVHVTICFDAHVSGYVCEKKWHASQVIHPKPDGSLLFEVDVAGTREIKRWILKWGAHAIVITPKKLAREIRQEALNMAANYRRLA